MERFMILVSYGMIIGIVLFGVVLTLLVIRLWGEERPSVLLGVGGGLIAIGLLIMWWFTQQDTTLNGMSVLIWLGRGSQRMIVPFGATSLLLINCAASILSGIFWMLRGVMIALQHWRQEQRSRPQNFQEAFERDLKYSKMFDSDQP